MEAITAGLITFLTLLAGVPVFLMFAACSVLYAIVDERTCRVYVLFGRVVGGAR